MADRRIAGTVERLVFASARTGYAVVRLTVPGESLPVTAVGTLADLVPGDEVSLVGDWVVSPQYGRQFKVVESHRQAPHSAAGIEKYLGSKLVQGVGRELARRIVETFGADTLTIIEENPSRLQEVPGIGPKRIARLTESIGTRKDLRETVVFLGSHGVSQAMALRIHRQYGHRALTIVRTDPYRLAREVKGVGFLSADRIATALGVPRDDPARIHAGVFHTLDEAAAAGHAHLPRNELQEKASILLGIDREAVAPVLIDVERKGHLVVERVGGPVAAPAAVAPDTVPTPIEVEPAVYLHRLRSAETSVARLVARLAVSPPSLDRARLADALARAERQLGIEYHPLQREAVLGLSSSNLLIITGGPGTGKTTLLRGLIEVFRTIALSVTLCAPTGRATKRMEEATGYQAQTIHRLLHFQPRDSSFQVNETAPLTVGALVVDEASMIDLELAEHLLAALRPGTVLVVVGDVDQLPSVGPGTVLKDLIACGLPTVRLTHVFRQSSQGLLVHNAHRINGGEMPVLERRLEGPTQDFYFIERNEAEAVLRTIVELVTERIPRRFGFDAVHDVQVMAPMHRGEVGVESLNRALREKLNPARPGAEPAGGFRSADKVMQVQNDYEREVFNGDMGVVVSDDPARRQLVVDFDGRRVACPSATIDQLQLAYAISVHKSQGSEYPAVVLALHSQHWVMLQRNLLYTALTRARRLAVIVGPYRALRRAVTNDRPLQRYSALAWRLGREMGSLRARAGT